MNNRLKRSIPEISSKKSPRKSIRKAKIENFKEQKEEEVPEEEEIVNNEVIEEDDPLEEAIPIAPLREKKKRLI